MKMGYRLPSAAYNTGNSNFNAYRTAGFAAAVYYGGEGSSGNNGGDLPQSGPQVWGLAGRKKKKKQKGKMRMGRGRDDEGGGEFNSSAWN